MVALDQWHQAATGTIATCFFTSYCQMRQISLQTACKIHIRYASVFFATLFFHCSLYVWLWCWFLICIFDMWTVRSSVSCKWMMHNVKRVSRFVLQLVAVVSTQITNVVYSSSICCSCSVCRPFSRKTRDSLPVDPLLPSGIYCKTYVWLHGVPDANHQVSSFFCPSYRNQCHCVFLCCLCKYQ